MIGSGYSAITTISYLLDLKKEDGSVQISWVTRHKESPYKRIENDSLPERDRLAALGNDVAAHKVAGVNYYGGIKQIEELKLTADNKIEVKCFDENGKLEVIPFVDEIVGLVGYEPDITLFRELHVHQCYASEGPMKLAAALLSCSSSDCLAQTATGPETLKNPEPNFFILGAKSYGRNSNYLLRLGVEQIHQILSVIS